MTIITFGCQSKIYVYHDGCGYLPRQPFRGHKTIKDAAIHLMERGIFKPEVIEFKREEIRS